MAISTDSFVTQKQLDNTRSELKSDIAALRHDMNKGFKEVKSEIEGVKSEIEGVKSEIEGVKSLAHRTHAMVEEMKTQNQIVYERVDSLNESIENVRTELKEDYRNIMDVLSKIRASQK